MVYFIDIVGNVAVLHPPNKCTVTFVNEGGIQKALMMTDKLIIDGKKMNPGEYIQNHLNVGSSVRFCCHDFATAKDGMYDWYVTNAWRQHKEDRATHIKGGFLGLYNCVGKVSTVAKRQGVLTCTNHLGQEQNVLFLGSKLSLFGRRSNSKHSLQESVTDEKDLLFDAVPCLPNENDFRCSWFATIVWKGKKPSMDYESTTLPTDSNLAAQYKQVANSPRSFFFRGKGVIMNILDDEFGLALLAITDNKWESVLFHRSTVVLFKSSIPTDTTLQEVFKKGDKVRIIAAVAPKSFLTQWLGTQITVDVGPKVILDVL